MPIVQTANPSVHHGRDRSDDDVLDSGQRVSDAGCGVHERGEQAGWECDVLRLQRSSEDLELEILKVGIIPVTESRAMDVREFSHLEPGEVLEDGEGILSVVTENRGNRVYTRILFGHENASPRKIHKLDDPLTNREIAAIFGISTTRVSQILGLAERKFKKLYLDSAVDADG